MLLFINYLLLASSLDRMIAVHENRLEYHDQIDKELFTLIEDRRKEAKEQYETLHQRVGRMRDEFAKELASAMKDIMAEIKDLKERDAAFHKDMNERLKNLEMWRWVVSGAALVIGFLISQSEILNTFFS